MADNVTCRGHRMCQAGWELVLGAVSELRLSSDWLLQHASDEPRVLDQPREWHDSPSSLETHLHARWLKSPTGTLPVGTASRIVNLDVR